MLETTNFSLVTDYTQSSSILFETLPMITLNERERERERERDRATVQTIRIEVTEVFLGGELRNELVGKNIATC